MSLEIFKQSLKESTVVKKGKYQYVINPITDGVPSIKPDLLDEVVCEMYKRVGKCGPIDKIVTLEAMGIPLAGGLSLKMNKPFTIIRKKQYDLPDEISVDQITGYSKSKFFINGVNKDDNVIIVDDVLSTGGSLKAVLTAFEKIGVNVKGVFIAVDKGEVSEEIKDEYNINVDVLVNINVIDGKVVVKNI